MRQVLEHFCEGHNVRTRHGGTPSPHRAEGGGEGEPTSQSYPPHPTPLPCGEREQAVLASRACPQSISVGARGMTFEGFVPRLKIGCLMPGSVIDNHAFEFYRLAPLGVMLVMVGVGLEEFSSADVE